MKYIKKFEKTIKFTELSPTEQDKVLGLITKYFKNSFIFIDDNGEKVEIECFYDDNSMYTHDAIYFLFSIDDIYGDDLDDYIDTFMRKYDENYEADFIESNKTFSPNTVEYKISINNDEIMDLYKLAEIDDSARKYNL